MSFSRRNNFHNSTAELTDEFLFNEHRTGYVAATTAVFLVGLPLQYPGAR